MKTLQRLVAYSPNGSKLGPVPSPTEYQFGLPLNDVSSATLSYMDGAIGWQYFSSYVEVGLEYSVDNGQTWTEYPNGRYIRITRNSVLVGQAQPKAFTMPGYGWLLNQSRQMKITGLNADGKRPFNSANAGMIMKTLIDEAKLRNASVINMSYDFTTTTDSAGNPWNKVLTIGYEPGLDYFTILNNLSLQGIVDWRFQGRTLQMYNADTTLSIIRDVKFQDDVDIKGLPVQGSIEDLANTAVVVGDRGVRIVVTDLGTGPAPWGKFEKFISQGGVSNSATLQLLAQSIIDDNAHEKVQYSAEMNLDKTRYEPVLHYSPGDYVTSPSEAGPQSFRVRQLNFARSAQGEKSLTVIMNDRFVEREIRNARRTNGISGGASAGGNGSLPSKDPGARKPAGVSGLVVTSTAISNTLTGEPYAIASMSYSAVTTDEDGIALEIDRYQFRGQRSGSPAWVDWGSDTNLTHEFQPLVPGSAWNVQARAVSVSGTPGAWSSSVALTVDSDVNAPPKPSAPLLTSKLGVVTVRWNGRDSTNAFMPRDFRRLDIYRVGTATPVGTLTSTQSSFVDASVTIGDSVTYSFQAVDASGNVGVSSDQSTITVASIMSDPAAALDINNNVTVTGSGTKITYSSSAASGTGSMDGHTWFQITSGVVVGQWRWDAGTSTWVAQTLSNSVISSLDAGKITTGTLAAARIASGAITADKIAAGAIDATKLSATAIDGKVINGVQIYAGYIFTGTRTSATAGVGAYIRNDGFMNWRTSDGAFLAVDPNGNAGVNGSGLVQMYGGQMDFRMGGTSSARMLLEASGRMRLWTSAGDLFMDINAQLASQNMKIEGGVFMNSLNLGIDGNSYGILIGTTDGVSVTANGGNRHVYLNPSGSFGQVRSAQIYYTNLVSGSIGQVGVRSDGVLGLLASASRFKLNVEPHGFSGDILSLAPISYNDKSYIESYVRALESGDENAAEENAGALARSVGLLAEDVAEAGFEEFVVRDPDGEVMTISYERLWLPLIPLVKDLSARLAAVEQRLERDGTE